MPKRYLAGLDVGGGSGRCLLVDVDSGAVTVTQRPWSHPAAPGTGGWGYDLDTQGIWRTLGDLTQAALARAEATAESVIGIAATSMRHGIVVIDKDGGPLLAVPNRDARAAAEGLELADERGLEFHRRTGHWPSPIFAAARLLWMQTNRPADLDRAYALLSISDWVSYLLSGEIGSEPSHAGETLLLDLQTRNWASDLIDSLGLPASICPALKAPGTRLGELTQYAAERLGLCAGIPVVVGGADTQCGLLGSGVTGPGQTGVLAGTTTPLQMALDQPIIDPEARIWTGQHVLPGQWVLESNAGAMGEGVTFAARLLYPMHREPEAALFAEAAASHPGAEGFTSTLGADIFNARSMSLPVGNLTLSHMIGDGRGMRHHLARAVIEGLAYALRANLEQITAAAGTGLTSLALSGGMARSEVWVQIVSDVTGLPVQVAGTYESTALGAAICAGVGAGVFGDLREGAQTLVQTGREHTPDPAIMERYAGLYESWAQMRAARSEADATAANLALQALMDRPEPEAPLQPAGFRPRILVTAQIDERGLTGLQALGDVTYSSYREQMRLLAGDDLVEALQGYHVFITEVDVVDADILAQLPDLRVVASCRGNAVNVDAAACTAFGIPVLNTPGRNADAVADLALAFILMLARKLPEAAGFLREPGSETGDMGRMGMAYSMFQGSELWERTVGVVGFGAIGRRVAERLLPFGAQVLTYDPFVTPAQAQAVGARLVDLETLLRESDFVTLHAPVTAATVGMIGAAELALMKPTAYLVNTARAALTEEDALLAALQEGRIAGAALDVFAIEPPGSDYPLLNAPNVIATPHIGGNTFEVAAHQGAIIAEDLGLLLRGFYPHHVLNPEALHGFRWHGERKAPDADTLEQISASGGPAVSDLELKKGQESGAASPADSPKTEEKRGLLSGLRGLIGSRGEQSIEQTSDPAGKDALTMLIEIISRFLSYLETDSAMQSFAQNRHLTMLYVLSDAEVEFYMSFQDGTTRAALGQPPTPADITLKMKADIFDGMMMGRVNGTTAAMTGKLKFSGDTSKAMSMQKVQKDMGRLYARAREEVGDPGDLSRIGAASQASPPEPATTRAAAPAASAADGPAPIKPPSGHTGDERDEMLDVLNEMYQMGLITATGGNISVRCSSNPDHVWITPSQIFKGTLRADMMVRVDLEGETLDEDALSASSERRVHTEILKRRPDLNAVIHTHAPWATLLALTETPFLPISTEAAFLGDIPRVPFIMPGTRDLGVAVAEAMGEKGSVVLMQNHGLVVAGSSLRRAANNTEVVERYSELILRSLMLGKQPATLPDEVVQALREVGEMMA